MYLRIFKNNDDAYIDASDIKCAKLDTKFDGYVCFRIIITVASNLFEHTCNVPLSANSWPVGIIIQRFFKPNKKS